MAASPASLGISHYTTAHAAASAADSLALQQTRAWHGMALALRARYRVYRVKRSPARNAPAAPPGDTHISCIFFF